MGLKHLVIELPFLRGIEVTGKDEPPAIENISHGTQHLLFLGNDRAKLSGEIEITLDSETMNIIPMTGGVQSIQLRTEDDQYFRVLPHRIQIVPKTGRKQSKDVKKSPKQKRGRMHGSAYGRNYDFECKLLERSEKEAIFQTISKPTHRIKISPRHIGFTLNQVDPAIGKEKKAIASAIVAIYFDEEYISPVGNFIETKDEIEIIPYEY